MPSGQIPCDPGVHGANGQIAASGTGAIRIVGVQQPRSFDRREHRVQRKSADPVHRFAVSGGIEFLGDRSCSTVLPTKQRGQRLSAGAIPQHQGFALIADPDRRDTRRIHLCKEFF